MHLIMKKTILLVSFFFAASSLFLSYGQETETEELISEGIALHDDGKFKEAIKKYNEALQVSPHSIHATYELSLSYLALQDFQNALKYSTSVLDSDDKLLSTGAYAVKSKALTGMDKIDEAISLLQEGLKKNGDEYLLHFNLALNYYEKGNLESTLEHVKKAIDLDKFHSDAFLLNAYALNDNGLWVQSVLSFQMFLILEPDSKRSKNAFEEMLNTLCIKTSEEPVQRSFVQQQWARKNLYTPPRPGEVPQLSIRNGLNRNFVYHEITSTLDSLKTNRLDGNPYTVFMVVNRNIIKVLTNESKRVKGDEESVLWTFYIPFFSHIAESDYYETYARYISVSYFPESLEWWNENPEEAANFVNWFEKGDEQQRKS